MYMFRSSILALIGVCGLAATPAASQINSAVIDDLTYHTASPILDWLVRPGLWALLAYRKPIYRRLLEN